MALDFTKRSRTKQERILFSVVDRLIDRVQYLNDQNCWVCDQPIPLSLPGGRYAVTVSPGGGQFPHEFFGGAGKDTLTEDGSLVITPIVVNTIDRPRRAWQKIAGGDDADIVELTPNLLSMKHDVLDSMIGDEAWEPNHGGVPILRDMLSPISCTDPSDVPVGETQAIAMQIRFGTLFDWDLS